VSPQAGRLCYLWDIRATPVKVHDTL